METQKKEIKTEEHCKKKCNENDLEKMHEVISKEAAVNSKIIQDKKD